MDKKVKFYANTFGGTVFVTKDGEIVYSLPDGKNEELKVQNSKFIVNETDKEQAVRNEKQEAKSKKQKARRQMPEDRM